LTAPRSRFSLLLSRRPPSPTLFPYTTLFRSLAIVPVMIAASSFGLITYLAGNRVFADYLQIHYVAGSGELVVLCGALVGAGIGLDRKSTRLNSSHVKISYAVFFLKKKRNDTS